MIHIIHAQVFVWLGIFISLEYMLKSTIVGSCDNSTFNNLSKCQAVFKVAASFHIYASYIGRF